MTSPLSPAKRKQQILDAAVDRARDHGYMSITRSEVATAAGVSTGLVNKYYSTFPQLKRAVMRAAIQREILEIIAQGLTAKDPQAFKAPDELKKRAVDSILG